MCVRARASVLLNKLHGIGNVIKLYVKLASVWSRILEDDQNHQPHDIESFPEQMPRCRIPNIFWPNTISNIQLHIITSTKPIT